MQVPVLMSVLVFSNVRVGYMCATVLVLCLVRVHASLCYVPSLFTHVHVCACLCAGACLYVLVSDNCCCHCFSLRQTCVRYSLFAFLELVQPILSSHYVNDQLWFAFMGGF